MREELVYKIVIRNNIYKDKKVNLKRKSKSKGILKNKLDIIKYNIEKIIIKADKIFKSEIVKLLHNISFKTNTIGYQLYKDAIYYILSEDLIKEKRAMTNLYIELGLRNDLSKYAVEKNMRYALNKAWDNQNLMRLEMILGYSFVYNYEKPSNGELLTTLVEYLKEKLSHQNLDNI